MSKRREFRPLFGMDALEDRVVLSQGVATAAINILPPATLAGNVAYVKALDAFVGRNESAAAIQNEASQLTNGRVSRTQLARSVLFTQQGAAAETTGLYQVFLGRNPLPSEIAFYNNNGRHRPIASQTAQILGSNEYFTRVGGTNEGFVTGVYRDFLGRNPDASAQHWLNEVNRGVSREAVAAQIVNSPEGVDNQVFFAYTRTLDRAPDAGARSFSNSILRGGSVENVILSLASSQEFYDKAQATPTTVN